MEKVGLLQLKWWSRWSSGADVESVYGNVVGCLDGRSELVVPLSKKIVCKHYKRTVSLA